MLLVEPFWCGVRTAGRVKKLGDKGFTLIEVVIVTAIIALLGAMALFGRGELKARYQFNAAIEQAKGTLLKVKNEANTTVNDGGGSGGTNESQIFFAKRVRFNQGSGMMQIQTFVIDRNPTGASVVTAVNNRQVELPYQVVFQNVSGAGANDIWFVRWPFSGELYTYTPPPGSLLVSLDNFNPSNNRGNRPYRLVDSVSGYTADVFVDGMTGAVTRVFY
jgi:prepilin-type N-terminal cleavage/methylation domain-containing protein